MRDGIGFATVLDGFVVALDGVRGRRRRVGASLRGVCVLALGLLGVGRAVVPASAQTLAVSNQVFPLTQVGQSTTQAVTFTYSDDLGVVVADPDRSGVQRVHADRYERLCMGELSPGRNTWTLSITFTPKLPGWASAPAPISRSAPVQISFTDNHVPGTVSFALTGTGTGPVAAMSPGLISDPVGSDTAVEDYVNTPYGGDGGPASAAIFYNPAAMAVDTLGNIYIADTYNDVVRVVYKGGTQLASLIALENPAPSPWWAISTPSPGLRLHTILLIRTITGGPRTAFSPPSLRWPIRKALRWMRREISISRTAVRLCAW